MPQKALAQSGSAAQEAYTILYIYMAQEDVFKKIVSHCKEYGFVFPSSDIYDGLGAVYDYGQNGVELKNNIKQYWWQAMVLLHDNIVASTLPFSCTPPFGRQADT